MRETSRPAIWPASFVAWRCASLKYAGTVMTALLTDWPRYSSAACFSFCRIIAEISGGADARVAIGRADDAVRHHLHFLGDLVVLAAHESLDGKHRVFRVCHSL